MKLTILRPLSWPTDSSPSLTCIHNAPPVQHTLPCPVLTRDPANSERQNVAHLARVVLAPPGRLRVLALEPFAQLVGAHVDIVWKGKKERKEGRPTSQPLSTWRQICSVRSNGAASHRGSGKRSTRPPTIELFDDLLVRFGHLVQVAVVDRVEVGWPVRERGSKGASRWAA